MSPGSPDRRRPRAAFTFTVLPGPDRVRLIAGEDLRYTLRAPGIEGWMAGIVARLDGRTTLDQMRDFVPETCREDLRAVIERMYDEGLVVEGEVREESHTAIRVHGTGTVRRWMDLAAGEPVAGARAVEVLCQDTLDFAAARAFNRDRLAGGAPWMWVTTGPGSRGYVSPLFLPRSGPCLTCLLTQFERLSPFPELYEELVDFAHAGGTVAPTDFPAELAMTLAGLAVRKSRDAGDAMPAASTFRLHVLDRETLGVTTHPVMVDPACEDCGARGR